MGLQRKIALQAIVRDFKKSPAHAATLAWLANPSTDVSGNYVTMVSACNQFQFDISNNAAYSLPAVSIVNDVTGSTKPSTVRIVTILPDGTVHYDSNKPFTTNNAANVGTTIGENHNSRQVFMKAYLGAQGTIAYESKYSKTDGKFEEGAAIALGADGETTLGAIRFTVLAPTTN